jgi:hypothetical protein
MAAWRDNLDQWVGALSEAMRRDGARAGPRLEIEDPLTKDAWAEIERAMGRLPRSLRHFATTQASRLAFFWELDDAQRPRGLGHYGELWGRFAFDARDLVRLDEYRQELLENWSGAVDPDDDFDPDMETDDDELVRFWHRSVLLQFTDNGDAIVFDRGDARHEPAVVYWDHESGNKGMGADFTDFVERYTYLGCPGPEEWQWDAFVRGRPPRLDPLCANARRWRKHFGLSTPAR